MTMNGWTETYRGVVSPWECDVTEHFTIAYYLDRLEDAASTIAESLGLRDLSRAVGRRFDGRFDRELRDGASFHVLNAPIALGVPWLPLGQQHINCSTDE